MSDHIFLRNKFSKKIDPGSIPINYPSEYQFTCTRWGQKSLFPWLCHGFERGKDSIHPLQASRAVRCLSWWSQLIHGAVMPCHAMPICHAMPCQYANMPWHGMPPNNDVAPRNNKRGGKSCPGMDTLTWTHRQQFGGFWGLCHPIIF